MYLSNFHPIKIPMAIVASAISIQFWLDEKPIMVASLTSRSDIDVLQDRESKRGSKAEVGMCLALVFNLDIGHRKATLNRSKITLNGLSQALAEHGLVKRRGEA
jgi:hypothetical protein